MSLLYRTPVKKVAHIRIAGPDQKGIIATVTQFLFKNSCNIEDIDQKLRDDFLTMNMVVDYTRLPQPLPQFLQDLQKVGRSVGMTTTFQAKENDAPKKTVILASLEDHCLDALLSRFKRKNLPGSAVAVIANHPTLKPLAQRYGIPFHYVPAENRKAHEQGVLKLLDRYEADLVVLARYMQILSPDFVFRYEGRIINIHPSLLPAFPGPRSYHQALNKGVEVLGVTAHFVTTNLDEGPIITQESFRVDKTADSLETIIKRGRDLEAKALTRAVELYLKNKLYLRRGKVYHTKRSLSLTSLPDLDSQ